LASALPTTAASAASTHSRTSWHNVFSFSPAPPLAARHRELPIDEFAIQISSQHLVDHPAGETDHLHTGGNQSSLDWHGNRAADEDLGSEAQELGNAGERIRSKHPPLLTLDLVATLNINQQEIDRDIEHGRDATLPLWNRDSHHVWLKHSAGQNSNLFWQ
jgi:hypothetical protein